MTSIGYVATRIERAGSHRVYFNRLDDNGGITNILITPSANVRAVRLCRYDTEGERIPLKTVIYTGSLERAFHFGRQWRVGRYLFQGRVELDWI